MGSLSGLQCRHSPAARRSRNETCSEFLLPPMTFMTEQAPVEPYKISCRAGNLRRLAQPLTALGLVLWLSLGATGLKAHAARGANAGDFQFCVVSDLHFNPFRCSNKAYTNLCQDLSVINWKETLAAFQEGTSNSLVGYDQAGRDSSFQLIQSVVSALTNRCPSPAFVLCLGDAFAHETEIEKALSGDPAMLAQFGAHREEYVIGSEALVAQLFQRAGLTNVYPVLGNNDSIRDYREPSPHFLRAYARAWAECVPPNALSGPFGELGCYSARLPGFANRQLVVLNSSLFSADPHHLGDPQLNSWTKAKATMAWLRAALAASSDNLLACHIPPGMDFHHSTPAAEKPFWEANFTAGILSLFVARHESISGWFCSHTHNDEFRLIYAGPEPSPAGYIHLAPSVSPLHQNRPAFQIFAANRNGRIRDYQTFVLKDPARAATLPWKHEYSFSSFTRDEYNAQTLHRLFDSTHPGSNRKKFGRFYAAGGDVPSIVNSDLYWRSTRLEAGVDP